MLPAPHVDIAFFSSRMSIFTKHLFKVVKFSTPAMPSQIVSMYRGRKKTIYADAEVKLNLYGVNRLDSVSLAFVKVEKGNTTKAPRCIQPRKPVYNLALGCYIKPIEHSMYKAIQRTFRSRSPIVMKGYNLTQVANILQDKWNEFHAPVAIGLDATKFDMHCSAAAITYEHSIYLHMYNNDPQLRKLLDWQLHNRGLGYCCDGRLKYHVTGKRFSGDMNTALGNCILMCGMIYSYLHDRGITKYQLVNNGDDCVVIVETKDLLNFSIGLDDYFLALGYRMVVEEPVYNLAQIEFCQMHPIRYGDNEIIMVRNLRTAVAKDTMCVLDVKRESAMRKWLQAVGDGGLAVTGGIPVSQAFYQMYTRYGMGLSSNILNSPQMQSSGFAIMSRGVSTIVSEPSVQSRLDVYLAWGITPHEQVLIEQSYADSTYSHLKTYPFTHHYCDLLDPIRII